MVQRYVMSIDQGTTSTRCILFDEPDALQRAQDAVRRPLGQFEGFGDLADPEPSGAARQQLQDRGGALDGLDRTRHARDPTVPIVANPAGSHGGTGPVERIRSRPVFACFRPDWQPDRL